MIQNYEKVGFVERKNGVCPKCGKRATRSKEFYQTINPWNQKTEAQILKEETLKAKEWLEKSTWHQKCEPKSPWGMPV